MKIIKTDGFAFFSDLNPGEIFKKDDEYYIVIEELFRENGNGSVNAVHLQTGLAVSIPYNKGVKPVVATMTVEG
jgi:hypothetical protein